MKLQEQRTGDIAVIEVGGRIDSTTSRNLAERLAVQFDAGCHSAVIDLKDTHYISSAGFREFLVAARRVARNDGKLALSGLSPELRRLFELGGFLDLFTVCASREEAIGICRP